MCLVSSIGTRGDHTEGGIMSNLWKRAKTLLGRKNKTKTDTASGATQPPPKETENAGQVQPDLDLLPWTYAGLIDDVMLRYTRDFISEEFFKKVLAKNVFFGGGILLNDGYLTQHPVARQYI